MIQAVLSNARHPEYGAAAIPFPIPRDEYGHCIGLLEALEIGDVSRRDCRLDEIRSPIPILKRLEKVAVNVDELDYLAKRLDSFTDRETAQFQSMAVRLGLFEMTDLINLTFCCQQATVITDFSDLEAIGRNHFMNQNGGCISHEQLEKLDARSEALKLILNEPGTVTPYGVVYDNGMKLEQLYDGRYLPSYHYDAVLLTVALTSREEPEDTGNITWIYLPASKEQIDRALLRSGIADLENMCFRFGDSEFPSEIEAALDFRQESIYDLNDLAWAVDRLSPEDCKKLGAVVEMAEPEYASQIPPEQLRWYAAFHNEGHHPHIHLMAWSRDGVHGRLTTDGIRKLRSTLTNVIFQDELWHLYEKKNLSYRDLVRQVQETMRQAIAGMERRTVCDPVIEQKMAALAERLKTVTGKKQYGYLPKALKRQADEIVDLLAAQPEVAACYNAWNGLRDELEQYYTDRPREYQPLSQQKEFKAIRNLVVREAAGLDTSSRQSEPGRDVPQQEGQGTSPAMALYTVRLLRQISAVFRDNARPPANPAGIRVESKRRQKLMEKRIAQGHKPDDHEVHGQQMA